MKACQLSDGCPVAVRDAALAPVMKALRTNVELSGDDLRANRVNEGAVIADRGMHSPILHAACNDASPLSLNAFARLRFYSGRVIGDLGKRIGQRIAALDLDQSGVALSAGISVQRLNNYIHGRRTPDLPTLVRLASALQTTTDWLLGAEDHRMRVAREVQRELLAAAGLSAEQVEAVLAATVEALRLLAVLPGESDDPLRPRMAARAAWHSRLAPKPH